MNLCNINHSFNYETEKLCRLFLPFEKINVLDNIEPACLYAVTTLSESGEALAELHWGDRVLKNSEIPKSFFGESKSKSAERAIAVSLYKCFVRAAGFAPDWGILTGVRPAKLYSGLSKKWGKAAAQEYFENELYVSPEKIRLCELCAKGEAQVINKSAADSFSLYISIPFCPSRCAYCSFVSHSVEQAKRLIPEYLNALIEEIKITGQIAVKLGLRLKTVYIGGGTPTTLSAEEISRLMAAVKENFDLSEVLEYTVEAGRPDTITKAKLSAIKAGGATRISINPQTMNDEVLRLVGRHHTAEDTVSAFQLARSLGFDNINMDLIAGLAGDNIGSFKATVDRILELGPENVTVHSLSLKRAADYNKTQDKACFNAGGDAAEMVRYALLRLSESGIMPYYMYRQSKTVGNLENVGYAKEGYEGCYNVYIMDETHTILACGASAVTKLREPAGSKIERVFNYKYPYEYISGFAELIRRKDKIKEFYNTYKAFDI